MSTIKTAIGVGVSSLLVAGCAMAATAQPASGHERPFWDGRHPAVWTSEQQPMCLPRYVGRHGILRMDNRGPRITLICQREVDGYGVWEIRS